MVFVFFEGLPRSFAPLPSVSGSDITGGLKTGRFPLAFFVKKWFNFQYSEIDDEREDNRQTPPREVRSRLQAGPRQTGLVRPGAAVETQTGCPPLSGPKECLRPARRGNAGGTAEGFAFRPHCAGDERFFIFIRPICRKISRERRCVPCPAGCPGEGQKYGRTAE